MSGLTAVLALLRALWPFFGEAIFGRASARAWLKTNFFSLVWLLFVMAMFAVVLRLSSTIRSDQTELKSLTTTNQALQQAFTADEAKLAQFKVQLTQPCPKPKGRVREPKPPSAPGIDSSVYPLPKPGIKAVQDPAVLDMLKQIHDEEH